MMPKQIPVSYEIPLHTEGNRKFTVLVSSKKGVSMIRYCAYRGLLCVCALVDKDEAWKIYTAKIDSNQYINPQLN